MTDDSVIHYSIKKTGFLSLGGYDYHDSQMIHFNQEKKSKTKQQNPKRNPPYFRKYLKNTMNYSHRSESNWIFLAIDHFFYHPTMTWSLCFLSRFMCCQVQHEPQFNLKHKLERKKKLYLGWSLQQVMQNSKPGLTENQIQWFRTGCGTKRKTVRRWPRSQNFGLGSKILKQEATL